MMEFILSVIFTEIVSQVAIIKNIIIIIIIFVRLLKKIVAIVIIIILVRLLKKLWLLRKFCEKINSVVI